MTNIKRSILYRIFFSFSCVLVFAGLVVWYIFNIQFVEGKRWRSLSDSLTLKYKVIQAARGNIYSEDGILLATSVPRYELRMDLSILNPDTFNKYIPILSQLLSNKFQDKAPEVYLQKFKEERHNKNRYFLIAKKLNFLDIKEIKTWPLFEKGRYKSGLIIEVENHRVLPYKEMMARTIGYVTNGKHKMRVGLEGAFNKELEGVSGKRLMQRISGGYLPVNDNVEVEPVNGKDIYTTINVVAQDIVNKALYSGLQKHQAHHGCAILMDVKTGEIKGIANLTQTSNGSYKETFNYAVGESFEPGSTFKLISALALLDQKKIRLGDSVLINNGSYEIKGKLMIDAEYQPYRKQTFAYAFEHSSNVGISSSMLEAFEENPLEFINYIKKLKLNQTLQVEIPGEGNPVIKEPGQRSWSRITLPWMSIGYDVKLTPLQLLSVYNAVANNGKMLKPFLVKAVGRTGIIEKKFPPIVINEQIADINTIKNVQALLEGVVNRGTAKIISQCRIPIAGKTGTSRISDGVGYSQGDYYSSFAGYFPANNPIYSIIIVVNRPKLNGYFGSVVAAPIASEIAEKVLGIKTEFGITLPDTLSDEGTLPLILVGNQEVSTSFLKRFTNYNIKESGNSEDWVVAAQNEPKVFDYSVLKTEVNTMPNISGMGLRDVLFLLENKKIKVQSSGKGKVYWQSVAAGQNIKQGQTVIVKLRL